MGKVKIRFTGKEMDYVAKEENRMTEVAKRIEKLRALMAEQNIDAYVVPTADFHQSEYVGEHFKARKFITGFSGSYGTAVIAKDDAGLWTDGRYFTQALTEMEGSGVRLMKMFVDDTPSTTEWLAEKIPEGGKVAFDGRVLSMGEGQEYEEVLGAKNITIEYEVDLIDQIWEDRPTLSKKPCFFLEDKYTGENVASKLKRVREKMAEYGATVHLIASLDDNAWLLNFRGDDIDFFPLVLDYVIVRRDSVDLYIDDSKLDDRIREEMSKNNVHIHPYNDIYEDAKKIGADEVALIDPMKMNYALYKSLPCKVVEGANPTILMKAIKNDVEIENIKNAEINEKPSIIQPIETKIVRRKEVIYVEKQILCKITPSLYCVTSEIDPNIIIGIQAKDFHEYQNGGWIEIRDNYYSLFKVMKRQKVSYSGINKKATVEVLRKNFEVIKIEETR